MPARVRDYIHLKKDKDRLYDRAISLFNDNISMSLKDAFTFSGKELAKDIDFDKVTVHIMQNVYNVLFENDRDGQYDSYNINGVIKYAYVIEEEKRQNDKDKVFDTYYENFIEDITEEFER